MKRLFLFYAIIMLCMAAGCTKDHLATVWDTTASAIDGNGDISADLTVTVTFSSEGDAVVVGTGTAVTATVNGNEVTLVNTSDAVVDYQLSGKTEAGCFKLYSAKKQVITLNGVSISNPHGAAINIQGPPSKPGKGKKSHIVVKGSNSLSDGSLYSETPDGEDEKGCLFSEGHLIVLGAGSLTVTAHGGAGISTDGYLDVMGSPTLQVSSTAGHGIRSKGMLLIESGALDISVSADMKKGLTSDSLVGIVGGTTAIDVTGNAAYDSDDKEYSGTAGVRSKGHFFMGGGSLSIVNSGTGGKGISCDGAADFRNCRVTVTTTGTEYSGVTSKGIKGDEGILFGEGCDVTVKCSHSEGIESKLGIQVYGGVIYSYSATDDAINSAGDFDILSGMVCGHSGGNDGLDANGDFHIYGGVVYAIGAHVPEVAIDANTEGGHRLYIEGGVIIAIGGLEYNASLTQPCYKAPSWTKNRWYALTTDGKTYVFQAPSSGGTPLVVSGPTTPTLLSNPAVSGGDEYFEGTLILNSSVSGGTPVTLSEYTGNGGPGGGPGGWK